MDMTSQHWSGRWILGGALIAVGLLFLMMNMGVIDRFPIWKFWPVILIAIGIGKFFEPYHRAEGFWLMGLGVWFQVSFLKLYGYGFRETWPAVIILFGIFWMWESIEKQSRRRHLETDASQQLSDTTKI